MNRDVHTDNFAGFHNWQSDGPSARSATPRKWSLKARCLMLVLSLACLPMSGCMQSSNATEPEHVAPAHWPSSFANAIQEVDRRHEKLSQRPDTSKAVIDASELAELLDIIGWLPELAADSPMKKPEWDRVNGLSKQLSSLVGNVAQPDQAAGRRSAINNEISNICNQLKMICDSIEAE